MKFHYVLVSLPTKVHLILVSLTTSLIGSCRGHQNGVTISFWDIIVEWHMVVGDTKTEWNLIVRFTKMEWNFNPEKETFEFFEFWNSGNRTCGQNFMEDFLKEEDELFTKYESQCCLWNSPGHNRSVKKYCNSFLVFIHNMLTQFDTDHHCWLKHVWISFVSRNCFSPRQEKPKLEK